MQIIGHRGLMGLAPENSKQSFELAIAKGVDWVELDVQASLDGQGVVIHDEDLKRLAGVDRKIGEMTLAELQQVPLLSGEKLLSLQEALKILQPKVPVMIELKSVSAAHIVAKAAVSSALEQERTIVSSFSYSALAAFHSQVPNIPTAKLRRWWPFVSRRKIAQLGLHYVGLRHNWAQPSLIKRLQSKGLTVYAYTIDDPERLHKLDDIGLDMVVKNSLR